MFIGDDLSELVGVFIGDGCLSKWKKRGKDVRALVFVGNSETDYDYYSERISRIIDNKFNIHKNMTLRKSFKGLEIKFYDKSIISFFISLGFKFGKKCGVTIPECILNENNLLLACIRGVFNSDGSVYRRYSRKYEEYGHKRAYLNYAVIQIRNKSRILLEQIKNALEECGYNVNKIGTDKNCCYSLEITNQKDVDRFFKEIAFTHDYHTNRYKGIKSNKFLKNIRIL